MKNKKFISAMMAAAMIVAVSASLISCQATESTSAEREASVATKPGATEMKSFEIALQSLNSKANREAKAAGKSSGENTAKTTLIEAAKDLIYSTGVTENELLIKFGNNEEQIIGHALQLHAENANGKLKL